MKLDMNEMARAVRASVMQSNPAIAMSSDDILFDDNEPKVALELLIGCAAAANVKIPADLAARVKDALLDPDEVDPELIEMLDEISE